MVTFCGKTSNFSWILSISGDWLSQESTGSNSFQVCWEPSGITMKERERSCEEFYPKRFSRFTVRWFPLLELHPALVSACWKPCRIICGLTFYLANARSLCGGQTDSASCRRCHGISGSGWLWHALGRRRFLALRSRAEINPDFQRGRSV